MTGDGPSPPGRTPDEVGRADGADEGDRQARPRQARAIVTQRAILVAAGEQFARWGYHGTSLESVLTAAGVTKGSLYFHFGAKLTLAEAVIAQMLAGWDVVTSHVAALGLDPLASVLATTDQIVTVIEHDPIARGGARLLNDPALPPIAADGLYSTGEAQLTRLFSAAASAGLLRGGLDPARIARSVQAQLAGHMAMAERSARRGELWDRVTDMWQGMLPAIATPEWLAGWSGSDWAQRPHPETVTLA
jgi:TetR/AcrR family transcriptional regulator, repressor for uid operon